MSRPIKISEKMEEVLKVEFAECLKKKLFNGTVSFSKTFNFSGTDAGKATIRFSSMAFAKMTVLIQQFRTEVAWHGVVERDPNAKNLFHIKDVLVYPQVVSGATVDTDQIPYQTWLYSHDDDTFNNIRMQGHSHVDFATNPSGTDLAHQEKILDQLMDNDFYIFMICNKRFERTAIIYDLENNVLYENSDITVTIGETGVDLDEFMKNAREMVKYAYSAPANTYKGGVGTNSAMKPASAAPVTPVSKTAVPATTTKPATTTASPATNTAVSGYKEKPKPAIGRGWGGMKNSRNYDYDDYYDDDDPYGDYQYRMH